MACNEQVAEAHIDDGALMYNSWRRGLESPNTTLLELERPLEAGLNGHIDGLLFGGAVVAERLLIPELLDPKEPQAGRCAVAALALLQGGYWQGVRDQLSSALPDVREGVEHMLGLAAPAAFDSWLQAAFSAGRRPQNAAALLRIAAKRRIPLRNLVGALESRYDDETEAAAAAARQADYATHARAVHQLLWSPSPRTREAAVETALLMHSPYAFQRCLELAADTTHAHPKAMLLVALLGTFRDQEVLLSQLSVPAHSRHAIRALGFSGNAAHCRPLLQLCASADRLIAELAGEAVFNISGVGPTADAAALLERWNRSASTLDARCKLLQGRPWTVARSLELLGTAATRQRHPIALRLRIRSAGRADLETRAFARQQRIRLEQLQRDVTEDAMVVSYGS